MDIRGWHRGLVALLCCAGGLWTAAARADEPLDEGSDSVLVGQVNQQAMSVALRRQPIENMPAPYAGPAYGAVEGPSCGCNAHAQPSCGCQAGCGAEAGCGCEACCDCCNACCMPGCSCGWYGGVEVIWMKPHWNAFEGIESESFGGGVQFVSDRVNYDFGFDPSYRVFVGYTGCNGFGVRASWWRYDQDSDVLDLTDTVVAGRTTQFISRFFRADDPGERIVSQQSLKLETADFEVTNCCDCCGGNIIMAFGVRYARFNMAIDETFFDDTGALDEAVRHKDTFEGWGPTVATEFVRPLGGCAGLSAFGGLRGSLIFGKSHLTTQFVTETGALDGLFKADEESVRGIADLQIGLQYCHGCWFCRGGWQAQYWDNVAHTDYDDRDDSKASLGMAGFFVTLGATR